MNSHYKVLIAEASNRETGLDRLLSIREELSAIRKAKKQNQSKGVITMKTQMTALNYVLQQLDISPKSTTVVKEIEFLLDNGASAEDMINDHFNEFLRLNDAGRHTSSFGLLTFVLNKSRFQFLERTRYTSESEFVAHYATDQYKSLERLFGEKMIPAIVRHVEGVKAEEIFRAYSDRPNARLMETVLYMEVA